MIIVYDCSFIVLACVITIVNYDPKSFIVQATGVPRMTPLAGQQSIGLLTSLDQLLYILKILITFFDKTGYLQ
jgi:hypothetical protein